MKLGQIISIFIVLTVLTMGGCVGGVVFLGCKAAAVISEDGIKGTGEKIWEGKKAQTNAPSNASTNATANVSTNA